MKIKSLYIKGFGKYNQKSFDFKDGLNSYYLENGEGKTTLIEFIKAMFYGLESIRSNSAEFKSRVHYFPFNSGFGFGGNIVFEHEGNEYKIERNFDEKSDTKDSLAIYENNNEITLDENKYKEPGNFFFGIDKASFEKILFITSDEIRTDENTPQSIKNKLLGQYDYGSYENAIKKINENISLYNSTTREPGIKALRKNVNKIREEIRGLEGVKDELPDKYDQLRELEKQSVELETKKEEKRKYQNLKQIRNSYVEIQNELNKHIDIKKDILSNYKKGLPIIDEVSEIEKIIESNKTIRSSVTNSFTQDEEERFKDLHEKINSDINDQVFENFQKNYNNYSGLISNNERDVGSLKKFKEENSAILEKYNQTLSSEDEETCNSFLKEKPSEVIKRKDPIFIGSILISAIILIVGLILFAVDSVNSLICIILSVIGGVLTLGFIIWFIIYKQSSKNINLTSNNSNFIKDIFKKYNFDFIEVNPASVIKFLREMDRYENVKEELDRKEKLIKENTDAINCCKEELDNIIEKYSLTNHGYEDFINDSKDYIRLRNKDNQNQATLRKNQANIEQNNAKIKSFNDKYDVDIENNAEKIKEDISKFNINNHNIELCLSNIKTLLMSNNITEERVKNFVIIEEYEVDVEINDDYLNSEIDQLKLEIGEGEKKLEQLADLKEKLEEAQEEYEKAEKNKALLEKCLEHLETSNTELLKQYLEPLDSKFHKYWNILSRALKNNKISFNKDLKVLVEFNGENKDERHLSSGQTAILTFCYRLAFIENMYENEKPFVLLDDPFVQLDENYMSAVKDVIKELSNDMQIFYLTCHKSREI